MLKLVLPKGSLEKATLQLFEEADLTVSRSSSVDYRATISDPRVIDVRILRPQEIPVYVAEGLFDLGICGRDWVEERGATVASLGEMKYSKATARPVRIVIAVPDDSPVRSVSDLADGIKVSSEYPEMTKRFFAEKGIEADVQLSYGATEAKAPDIVDVVVDLTETGRALKAAGLRIIDEIMTSYTELVANPTAYADPDKRKAMEQIHTLLQGVLSARGRTLVKVNCPAESLDKIIEIMPALQSPTVNELFGGTGYAVEAVVPKNEINVLIPELKERGASDILELPISKIVP